MNVYLVKNNITSEIYIGLTKKKLCERRRDHVYEAFKRNKQDKFHAALREFGLRNFIWEVIKECKSYKEAAKEEMKLIQKYDSISLGYNHYIRCDIHSNKKKSNTNDFVSKVKKDRIK